MFEIPKLSLREKTGTYATGKARIQQILEAAYDLMITDGIDAITLREIARRCGIRVGAVSYYYKSRTDLIRDLVEAAVEPYYEVFDTLAGDRRFSAEERLTRLIRATLEDIQSEKTTRLFPELWTKANRDPFFADLVDQIYARQRRILDRLVMEMNPALDSEKRAALVLFVSAAIEGHTMFIGFEKPHAAALPMIENVAIQAVLNLVKTATNDAIGRQLPPLD